MAVKHFRNGENHMKKENGFFVIRLVLALCALLACVLWAVGQYAENEGERVVTSPEDLRTELQWLQLHAPYHEGEPLEYDNGFFTFIPDGSASAAAFAEGVDYVSGDGGLFCPVSLFEDPLSRETVFLDVNGVEIGRLPPPDGYDPGWVFASVGADASAVSEAGYDPARVVMTAVLRPAGSAEGETRGENGGEAGTPEGAAETAGVLPDAAAGPDAAGIAGSGGLRSAVPSFDAIQPAAATVSAATNASTAVVRRSRAENRVYVDGMKGSDAWTGFREVDGGGAEGPKRTIRAGLLVAARKKGKTGNRMLIRRGSYGESLNVRGVAVSVRAEGHVFLTRRASASSASNAGVGVRSYDASSVSATGTVSSASNRESVL